MGDLRLDHLPGNLGDFETVRIADTRYLYRKYTIADGDTVTVDVLALMGIHGNTVDIKTDQDLRLKINGVTHDEIEVLAAEDFNLEFFKIHTLAITNPAGYGVGDAHVRLFITG